MSDSDQPEMSLAEAALLLARHGGPWSDDGPTDAMVNAVAARLFDADTAAARDGLCHIASERHPEMAGRFAHARDLLA